LWMGCCRQSQRKQEAFVSFCEQKSNGLTRNWFEAKAKPVSIATLEKT